MAADVRNTQPPTPAPEPPQPQAAAKKSNKNYRGFVAGVFSGIAKLSGTTTTPMPPHSPPYRPIRLFY
jgi:hypothetical protein